MNELRQGAGSSEKHRPTRSLGIVLLATVLSAASSFVVLLIVAPALGPSNYSVFAVYWSALFMVVGVLFGVQQETTRAIAARANTLEISAPREGASPLRFASIVGFSLLALIASTGPLWAASLWGAGHDDWALPLAVAVASYVIVAALNGILAGRGAWGSFAAVPLIDGALRLLLVGLVLWFGAGGSGLAWAVAIPFPVSFLIVYLSRRGFVRKYGTVRETYRELAGNSSKTMVASAATAVLVNGFPVVLSVFGRAEPAMLGAVVLALTLTRAPILVPLTALQSMLISKFSGDAGSGARLKAAVLMLIVAATAFLAVAAALWGPAILSWIFGDGFALSGWLLGGLVLASGCLGVLTVTGAVALAAERHNLFVAGWVTGALVAILLVALLPFDIGTRAVVALICAPLLGSAVHFVKLRTH